MSDETAAAAKRGWLARLLGSGDAQAIAAIEAELTQARTDLELAAQRLDGEIARRETAEYDLVRLHEEHTARIAAHEAELTAVRFRAQGLAEQVEELRAGLEAEVRRAAQQERERASANARATAAEQARTTAVARIVKLERDSLAQREAHVAERDRLASARDQLVLERDGLVAERDRLLGERDRLRSECEQRAVERTQAERAQAELATTHHHVVHLLDAGLGALLAALGRHADWAVAESLVGGEPIADEILGTLAVGEERRALLLRALGLAAARAHPSHARTRVEHST